MSVTQHLMRPGGGSVNLTRDVPLEITNAIRDLVDENAPVAAAASTATIAPFALYNWTQQGASTDTFFNQGTKGHTFDIPRSVDDTYWGMSSPADSSQLAIADPMDSVDDIGGSWCDAPISMVISTAAGGEMFGPVFRCTGPDGGWSWSVYFEYLASGACYVEFHVQQSPTTPTTTQPAAIFNWTGSSSADITMVVTVDIANNTQPTLFIAGGGSPTVTNNSVYGTANDCSFWDAPNVNETEYTMFGSGGIKGIGFFRGAGTQDIADEWHAYDWATEPGFAPGGVGAHVVITPTHIEQMDDSFLSSALFCGPVTARPTRSSLEFDGLGTWLDTYIDATIARTSGTPAQWVGDLLTNGLSAGTVTATSLSNVTRSFPAHVATHREALDAWAAAAGAEYRINPDFTVDVATAGNLFVEAGDAGTVIVTRTDEGPDGFFRGVDGGILDQALTQLGPNIATKAVALAEGDGAAIAKGSATRSISLKTQSGGTPTLVSVLSAPSEPSESADTLASNFLNLQGMRRQVNVSSSTHSLPRYAKPGDEVYVFDPSSGLFDVANQVQFRGATIFPAKVRLLSYTWPIEKGMGVYVRSNSATPVYTDLTEWVDWEDGDTFWTVGDWSPPSYGRANRSDPEVEQRIAGVSLGGTFSGTTDGTTSALVVTHNLGFAPTSVVVQPGTPNGASTNDRFVSANVTNISSTTFTIGRCVSQDGSLLTSTAVTGYWIAQP